MSLYWQALIITGLAIYGWAVKVEPEQCNDKDFEHKLFDPKHSVCLQKHLNHTAMIEEFNDAIIIDDLPQFMKSNCPKFRQTLTCFDDYYGELQPCLNYFQRVAVKMIRHLIETSINYICANGGIKLINFVTEDGIECILNTQEKLKECGATIIGDDIINTITVEEGMIPKVNFSSRMFNGNECRLLYNTSHCMINVLQQECSNTSYQFASNLFISLFKQTPCWGVLGMLEVQWEHYLFALLLPKRIPTKDRICNDSRSAFDVAQTSLQKGSQCWSDIIDNDFLLSDLQRAFETRTLYSFLKKYCPKLHGIGSCVGDYLDSFQQCVDNEESVILNSTKRIVEGVANFVCHRDGERILLFLKENGFECLEEQKENIKECVKSTGITALFDNGNVDIEFTNPDFRPLNIINQIWVPQDYSPQECRILVSLEVCVYKMMRQCKDRSPANLISSLVRSVARKSPCWNVDISEASINYIHRVTIPGLLLIVLYAYKVLI